MKTNTKSKITILLIAFSLGLNVTGVAPILGVLKAEYAHYGTTMVQLLQSVTYFTIIIGALLLGWLTTKFSKKQIALFSLCWVGILGFIPMFIDGFEVIFICRLLIGLGFGILNPLNAVIITALYEPKDRAAYMGLHVVGMGSGAIVGNVLGGFLADQGYHWFYLIYVIAFVCLAGVWATIPHLPAVAKEKVKSVKLNKTVYFFLGISLFQLLLLDAFSINVGIYMAENISGSTSMTGLVTMVNAVFGLLTGVFFAKLLKKLGTKVVAYAVFLCAAGYLAILVIPGMVGVFICSITGGICRSAMGAGIGLMLANSVAKEGTAKASGASTVISGIGGLLAPTILGGVSEGVFGANTATNQLTLAFVGMLLMGIVLFAGLTKMQKKNK